jgi:hypothetical protein
MVTKYTIIECPYCSELAYMPAGVNRIVCPRCNSIISVNESKGIQVIRLQPGRNDVQKNQKNYQGTISTRHYPRPTAQVLSILRSYQSDCPQWLPLHLIFQRCIEVGIHPSEVQNIIDILKAEGFLEIQENSIRVIPLN